MTFRTSLIAALLLVSLASACSKSNSTCFATEECPEGHEGDTCSAVTATNPLGGSYVCLDGAWKANDIAIDEDASDDGSDDANSDAE